jgi:hypothetical protein
MGRTRHRWGHQCLPTVSPVITEVVSSLSEKRPFCACSPENEKQGQRKNHQPSNQLTRPYN